MDDEVDTWARRDEIFSKTPSTVERGAPVTGQHTQEILKEAGYDDETIASLVANGAVATGAI